jgi:hypothetical protein
MKRLRASLEIDDDGAVSIAEAAPLPAKAQRAARMARQLRTLQDALAKGKDFDLNGTRRPPLENRRRGPVPLAALRQALSAICRIRRRGVSSRIALGSFGAAGRRSTPTMSASLH